MSLIARQTRKVQAGDASDPESLRMHRRFELPLSGRFMRADRSEHTCRLKDISVGGVALEPDDPVKITQDERVIAYIDQLGGLEGPVVRSWEGGFAFKLQATQHKREKLAAQITWLLNEHDLKGLSDRKHERIVINNRSAQLRLNGGIEVACLILDVSISGASLACKIKPDIESEVWINRLRGHVVRHHNEGVGVQFAQILDPETLMAYFG